MRGVTYSDFQSDVGFKAPGFVSRTTEDPNAVFQASIIDSTEYRLGGTVLFSATGGGSTTLPSSIINSSLQTLGTLTSLTVHGNTSLTSGLISISSLTTGSIDNISIGATTASTGRFTTLTASSTVTLSPTGNVTVSPTGTITIAPTVVGSIDNVNIGSTTPGTGKFSTLELTQEATTISQVPTKGYVDKRMAALSIALGT